MLATASALDSVLGRYQASFQEKCFLEDESGSDVLMEAFGITAEQKAANRQYWGRELGMCWQKLVEGVFAEVEGAGPAITDGRDQLSDLVVGPDAVDTKYRLGSGDAGTLKKLGEYARMLSSRGYRPVLLLLREDNLEAAITRCRNAGWTILSGAAALQYVRERSGVDIEAELAARRGAFSFA